MKLKIKTADGTGCCDCDKTMGCDCVDIPCAEVDLSCLTFGGTAQLCGMEEYASPSSPPKLYRKQTITGLLSGCDGVGCGNPPGTDAQGFGYRWGGEYNYDAADCTTTNTQYEEFNGGVGPPAPGNCSLGTWGAPTPQPRDFVPSWISDFTHTLTPTQNKYTASAACNAGHQFGNGFESADLSEEDLESDAIDRLMAGAVWVPCSGSPCCLAQFENRGTLFSFAYQDAIWTITNRIPLTPGQEYKMYVQFYDRLFGVGSYTLLETLEVLATADSFGNVSVSDFVPNTRGYQTYAVAGDCPPP